MDNNYEWQKFSANNRIDKYRMQAETKRLLKENETKIVQGSSASGKIGFFLLIGLALFVVGFFLTGCQFGDVPEVKANSVAIQESSSTDSEQIQDRELSSNAAVGVELTNSNRDRTMSLGDRIRFKDELLEQNEQKVSILTKGTQVNSNGYMKMAERHQFHDKIGK